LKKFLLQFILSIGIALQAQSIEVPDYTIGIFIKHENFCLLYSEKHEQPYWVAYTLTKETLVLPYDRKGSFRRDLKVYSGTASNEDYAKSGYNRGHLAPSRDFPTNTEETYFYSNVSPQAPSFNTGVWKRLEDYVRVMATKADTLYIVTGPIFGASIEAIGPNKVTVPTAFYKVLLYKTSKDSVQAAGFIVPHRVSSDDLKSFMVPVDSIEEITDIDFFSSLPEDLERKCEKYFDRRFW